jgi:D-sedoheptulose 7-phosphate isomerase
MSSSAAVPRSDAASGATREHLRALAEQRFRGSVDLAERFFDAHADAISRACLAMAERFRGGGRLLAFGDGAAATDAQHVSVEFVHPVLVGKRALPALALGSDAATLTGAAASASVGDAFARVLGVLGREADIAMGIAGPASGNSVAPGLARAGRMRMLTLALAGGDGAGLERVGTDFLFVVPSNDPMLVQEVHETLYHVLWELVHVFFERGESRDS